MTVYMPFISCVETELNGAKPDQAAQTVSSLGDVLVCIQQCTLCEQCAPKSGLNWDALHSCATSAKGQNLVLANAKKTDALKPPHWFVPWVIINDKYSFIQMMLAINDLKLVVCNAYKGPHKPDKC